MQIEHLALEEVFFTHTGVLSPGDLPRMERVAGVGALFLHRVLYPIKLLVRLSFAIG